MQVLVVVQTGEDPPGRGIVFQVVEDPVHLVHLTLRVLVLDPQLVAIGLANGASIIRPSIPDVGTQVVDVVGLLLPDPQQLVHGALEGHFADGLHRELFPQVIAVDDTELLHGVGGRPIFPPRPHRKVGIPGTVCQDILAILDEQFICFTHKNSPLTVYFPLN